LPAAQDFLKYATEIVLQLAHNPCARKERFLASAIEERRDNPIQRANFISDPSWMNFGKISWSSPPRVLVKPFA
jgi:hypothetical protein